MKRDRFIGILVLAALLILIVPTTAYANSAYLGSSGVPIKPQDSSDIELEKQVMQIWLRNGFAEVENVYQFHNAGQEQEFVMGVPEDINSKSALKYGIFNFKAYVDGNEVDTRNVKTTDQKIGNMYGNINWYVHNVLLIKDQRRVVVHRYWIRMMPWSNKIVIPLDPGSTWKGSIGEATYVVRLMGDLNERALVYPQGFGEFTGKFAVLPIGFTSGKDQLTWGFTNYVPHGNMEIGIFPDKDYHFIQSIRVSGIHEDNGNQWGPKNLVDGDPTTAWGVGGPGKDSWAIFFFEKKKWVREFRIIPGYGTLGSMYKTYNRPRKITLRFSDGTSQRFELKDELQMQYLPLKPVETKYINLDIDSVYKGIYPDVNYISEVEIGELSSNSKFDPSNWKIGLNQVDVMNLRSRYSTTDLITIAATATVFLFIGWQVVVGIRTRVKKNKQSPI